MCPDKARVAYFDDDKISRMTRVEYLERIGGHKVVVQAGSLDQALELIPRLAHFRVNVVITDKNLDTKGFDGSTSKEVIKAIRAQHPVIPIIGSSSSEDFPGVDINCPKNLGLMALVDAVTSA